MEDGDICEMKLGMLKYFNCFMLAQSPPIRKKYCSVLYMKPGAHYRRAHWALTVNSKHKTI